MKFISKNKEKNVTVFEIGENWLKVVQRSAFGKEKKITKIVVENIASFSSRAVSSYISDLAKETRISSKMLTVSVQDHIAITRNLEFPSIDAGEIKDMIELQIGKLTPFTKNEIVYDYEILESNSEGYSKVLVVIVQREIIERYFKIIEGAGLQIEKISLGVEGLLRRASLAFGQEKEEAPYILMDVDYEQSDFNVILGESIVFSRSVPIGSSHVLGDMDAWEDKFIGELKNTIYAYQNEIADKGLNRIVISGAENVIRRLNKEFVRKKCNLEIDLLLPVEGVVATDEAIDQYNENTVIKNVSISAVLGLSLGFGFERLSFVPQERTLERAVRERGKDLYFSGIYLVFVLLTVSSIFLGRKYNRDRYLGKVKKKIANVQGKVKELGKMTEEISIVKTRKDKKNHSLDIIYEIYQAIPPEVYLMSIDYGGQNEVVIRGTSNTMSEVFKFVGTLEASIRFQNVKTKYATKRKTEERELTDFEIICPLEDR